MDLVVGVTESNSVVVNTDSVRRLIKLAAITDT